MSYSIYVVGSKSHEFKTIQSAINIAHKNGGGIIHIQPGVYVENLILRDKVDICGTVGISDTQTCVIHGEHTPPFQGNLTFKNVCLKSNSSIFFSNDEGVSSLFLISCFISLVNGYIFHLPHWAPPAEFVIFDLGDNSKKQNGVVFNLNGAKIKFIIATLGAGVDKPMTISGKAEFFTVEFNCPIKLRNNCNALFASGCLFRKSLIANESSFFRVFNSVFLNQKDSAIFINTNRSSIISQTSIVSSANTVIQGSGSGTVDLSGVSFSNNSKVDKKFIAKCGDLVAGNIIAREIGTGLIVSEGKNAKMGVAQLVEGHCFVNTSNITSSSRVFLTAQSKIIGGLFIEGIIPGQGFSIFSTNLTDTADIAWFIVEAI